MPLVQCFSSNGQTQTTSYGSYYYDFTSSVPNVAHKLCVRGSNGVTSYPLTTHETASQYCHFKVRVGGKDCYIAKSDVLRTATTMWRVTATSTYWENSESYETITTTQSDTFLSTISGGTSTYDAHGGAGTNFTTSSMQRDSINNLTNVAYGSYQSMRTNFAAAYTTDQTWWKIFSHEASQRYPMGGNTKKYAASAGTTLQDANALAIATVASNGTSSGFEYASTFKYAGGLPTNSANMRSAKNTTRTYTLSGYETQGMSQVTTMNATNARTSFPIVDGKTTTYVWNAAQQKTTDKLTIPAVRGIALSTSASYSMSITGSTAANYPNRASRSMSISRISYSAFTRWGQRRHTVLSSATGTSQEVYIEEWEAEKTYSFWATNSSNWSLVTTTAPGSAHGAISGTLSIRMDDVTDYYLSAYGFNYQTTNNVWTT